MTDKIKGGFLVPHRESSKEANEAKSLNWASGAPSKGALN